MRLYIAEKPSLAKAIASGLGLGTKRDGCIEVGDDIVTWCFGHLLELAAPEDYNPEWKRWRAEHLPYKVEDWKLKPRSDAAAQLKVIKSLLNRATEVIHAGDPDREGQLLVDEVLVNFGWRGRTTRLLLNATDPESVKKALAKIADNAKYAPLYAAALCRQRADWLVGMNLTVGATKLLVDSDSLVSVGRVQTPTLALVVRRDIEIENFIPQGFYFVEADVAIKSGNITLTHNPSEPRILDRHVADALTKSVRGHEPALIVVQKNAKELAPYPFILATFQKAAEELLGFGADKSLKTLQLLYEAQLVSYPRTDCPYLPAEQKDDALRIASAIMATGFMQEAGALTPLMSPKGRIYDSNKVAEHHGLVPTSRMPPPDLSETLRKAWELVSRQFLLSLLPDYLYEETEVSFIFQDRKFSVKGEVPLNLPQSWRALAPKKERAIKLAPVTNGEIGKVTASRLKEGKTTPPQHYTEATLIADMRAVAKYVTDEKLRAILKETAGIGTAATQAATIETLKSRGYLMTSGKKLLSTPFGRSVVAALPTALCDPGVTAAWEDALGKIAAGGYAPEEFMRRIALFVEKRLEDMRATKTRIAGPAQQNKASAKFGAKPRGAKTRRLQSPRSEKETSR